MWLRFLFLKARVGFMDPRCSETGQFLTTEWDIRSPSFCRRSLLPATYSTILWFILHHIIHLEYFTTMFVHITCRRRDLHRRQRIWLHWVAYLACNSAETTIQDPRKMVQELPLANRVNLGNTPIIINRRMGMVSPLHSSHFQALCSFITILHSTWHTVLNQPPA